MSRKVLFVTGIRSEYDILYPVMRACAEREGMEVAVVVTGAHLSHLYGYTVREVERDGLSIVARLESLLNADSSSGRVKSAAIQLSGLVDIFAQQRPTFVVAPMDREEAITVALAGAYMRIPVVHIGGGDFAADGNVDNAVRDAVTKLSHLHLVTTPRSRDRVIGLGEEPERIHVVGAPGLDRLRTEPDLAPPELWTRVGFDPGDRPFALVIQHAILTNQDEAGLQMQRTLDALVDLETPAFLSYPNSDAGSHQIIEVIERYARIYPDLLYRYQNLPRREFVNLMRRAHVLVGNSSCGIIEAPLFRLPVVNVGPRQRGREHAENVEFVDHDREQIRTAVLRAIFDKGYRQRVGQCVNPYGDGRSSGRIADLLAKQPVDQGLLDKAVHYEADTP